MLRVSPRPTLPVDLIQPTGDRSGRLANWALGLERAWPFERRIVPDKQYEVANVALFNHEPLVHVGFASAEARIGDDLEGGAFVHEPGPNGSNGRVRHSITVLPAEM